MINLNQLRVFYCVAKNSSYTNAAKELFITQPAVTAQVKLFEEWCELKFFKKKGRGIILTDEGKTVYAHARKIFEYEKNLESALDDLKQLKQGVLRIGSTKTYVRHLMPFLTRRFHTQYPRIKLHLNEGSSLDMLHSLLDLKNEIAIISKVEDHPDVAFSPFSEEELIPVLNPHHPLAGESAVSFAQLAREPVIMRESGSGTRKMVNELFQKHKCLPEILIETSNSEFIKQLVARGDGISFLVKESVFSYLKSGILATVPLEGEKVYLEVNIASLKTQPLSPPAQAFLQTLDDLASETRPIGGIKRFSENHETPLL